MELDQEQIDIEFRALVLAGLWGIWKAIGSNKSQADWWRSLAIGHMDLIGQDTEQARNYRRAVMFPEMFVKRI